MKILVETKIYLLYQRDYMKSIVRYSGASLYFRSLSRALVTDLDVTTLLHGDDAEMVLLVDPDQEGLGIVMPDTTGIGPVAGHTGAGEEGRHGLVEEEVIVDQLILLGVGHLGKRVVLTLELTLEAWEGEEKEGDKCMIT